MQNKSELQVITKAKDLCEYVVTVTHKSPKEYRFTFVSRLQNLAINVVEDLYRANDVYVAKEYMSAYKERYSYMRNALTNIRLLAFVAEMAMKSGCIALRQYQIIAEKCTECLRLTGAWIMSDKKRLGI